MGKHHAPGRLGRRGQSGVAYDVAGNLVDGTWYTFSYDATGQQTRAACPGYVLDQSYDGDRLRGKKVDNGTTTYYLRSSVLGGQVVAELSNTGAWTRGYVYLGGQMVALQGGTGGAVWTWGDSVMKLFSSWRNAILQRFSD